MDLFDTPLFPTPSIAFLTLWRSMLSSNGPHRTATAAFLGWLVTAQVCCCFSYTGRILANYRVRQFVLGNRPLGNDYGADGYGGAEFRDSEENYWEQHRKGGGSNGQRGGLYSVHFDKYADPNETELFWETFSDGKCDALLLLPPAAVDRPTAVLHFVGGTFFGSTPKLWYCSFLESVVRNTQCAIVVTPIPVTLLQSPLDHIELGQKLQYSFEKAWTNVLEDEYGDLSDIPLCGVGHSLGARLLVVLTTLSQNKRTGHIPPYKSFALISFTNYGAAAGIPGLATLFRQSKAQEHQRQLAGERERRSRARQVQHDWWLNDGFSDAEDEEGWEELLGDIQKLINEQTDKVKGVLTPKSDDLEFFPSPDMLWKAVKNDRRYRIPETLLVQFDDDKIDQSSRLAQLLRETKSSDVKFARLRGTHLSPISAAPNERDGWLPSGTSDAIWRALRGRRETKAQKIAMRELRQTIVSYVKDVVTK